MWIIKDNFLFLRMPILTVGHYTLCELSSAVLTRTALLAQFFDTDRTTGSINSVHCIF